MRADYPWIDTLIVLAALQATAAVIGFATGHVFLSLWLATLVYLGWQLRYLVLLERWLLRGDIASPPDAPGIWGKVFASLRRSRTRHRSRRRQLAQLLARFTETANAVPDGVVVLGAGFALEWWNDKAASMLGLRSPQDQGSRIGNLIRSPEFGAFLRDRRTDPITLPAPANPRLSLEIRLVPYGEQHLLLVRDVTRLQRLETMRRDFVANVSHELRTPLTVVRGLSETLADEGSSLAPEDRDMLMLIQQQTERMSRLVDDLLLLARLETSSGPAESAPVDVPALLQGLRDEAVALSGERGHDIRLEISGDCELLADEGELRSAFSNLVFNAVNYTPAGGTITMRWSCDSQGAQFAVIDTGIGIAPEHIPRLTERFYRVDRGRSGKTGGTGLGLAIVKHILQRYGGRLTIDSRVGQGSTFTCHFPASVCRPLAADRSQRPLS